MTAAATMCVEEAEQVEHHDHQDMENTKKEDMIHNKKWPLHCDNHNLLMDTTSSFASSTANSLPLESICEETVIADKKQNGSSFVPALRSGEWSDIGGRPYMEDTHICIGDMAKRFGYNNNLLSEEAVSFYANAGDCRAVLSRHGAAIEMSKDHRPYCIKERKRIESLGGFIDDGYLNGQLGVTRALGDWHLEGMKETGGGGGPLSAEPELKLMTLTKEDEFLIIASDGIWDVFRSQNAVDFARRRLQEHNDVKQCCKQIVEEAIKRGATDNLTVVMVCFHSDPPPPVVVERARVRRSISAEGLHNLKCLLQG
ncbi:hypothetical protein Ahy_B01g055261 [Arachis hypogaea]|uniref:PPM-type phosphatase domain-containing protein n=1 Tax=Arachis hypogaea TaxID=3818 RepID=A0A445AVM9_ARAHY|nr:hypothetical protein Ahy_B01g055261 [Arachis hypogaea]